MSSFSVGDMVFVGASICPAKFVQMVDETTAEVEWPNSKGTTWERFYPIEKIQHMSSRRKRQRTRTNFFSQQQREQSPKQSSSERLSKQQRRSGGRGRRIKSMTTPSSTKDMTSSASTSIHGVGNRSPQPKRLSVIAEAKPQSQAQVVAAQAAHPGLATALPSTATVNQHQMLRSPSSPSPSSPWHDPSDNDNRQKPKRKRKTAFKSTRKINGVSTTGTFKNQTAVADAPEPVPPAIEIDSSDDEVYKTLARNISE